MVNGLQRRRATVVHSLRIAAILTFSICGLQSASAAEIAVSAGFFYLKFPEPPVEAGLELRLDEVRIRAGDSWELIPAFGVMAAEDNTLYGYGGLRLNIEAGARWLVTFHMAAGAFQEGRVQDLGGVLEFRTGFEVARELANGGRVGINAYHLSNAGIYVENPGSNSLVLTYTF